MKNKVQAKIPGSLMLFGEHAVLHGGLAIVCAVERFITVTLTARSDKQVYIRAENFGNLKFTLSSNLKINKETNKSFKFVLAAIDLKRKSIATGFDLEIVSDFSPQLGLGSSAAVTVATLAVLEEWLKGKKPKRLKLFLEARKIIKSVQGVGSGADVAASVYGGAVAYRMQPLLIRKLKFIPELAVIYSGSKMTTTEVLTRVNVSQTKHPKIFKGIYAAINCCAEQAAKAINGRDWQKVGELMNVHQGLQEALGVSNKVLHDLICELRGLPQIFGAKISGSGLGDCVIGLGKIQKKIFPRNVAQKKLGIKQVEI